MRIAIALMLLGIMQAYATDAYSQKTRLTLNINDAPLVTVLDKIEAETEFFFLYNEKLLDTDRKVSVSANNQLIDTVLDKLFAGTDVTHTIIDRKIILAPGYLTGESEAQQLRIAGKVTNSNGEPLPGVTIAVKGRILGTATAIDGTFTLDNVQASDVLIFSFIGMKSEEVPVGSQTVFNIVLNEELIGMDAVVVTALGIKREEKALATPFRRSRAMWSQRLRVLISGPHLPERWPVCWYGTAQSSLQNLKYLSAVRNLCLSLTECPTET